MFESYTAIVLCLLFQNNQASPISFSAIIDEDKTPGNPAPGWLPAPTK
jgi:hypothetical protein